MKLAILLFVVFIGSAGCGSEDSQGFLTDHNICKPNDENLASDTATYSPAGYEMLYGTLGSDPRAAQEINTNVKTELWGLQVYLQAEVKPSQGVKVEISKPDRDGNPGGESIADGTITAGNIPAGGDWVRVQLDDIVTLEKATNYWIRLTPNYAHSEANRAGWGYVGGSGFATFSIQNSIWTRDAGKQALYRFIECR